MVWLVRDSTLDKISHFRHHWHKHNAFPFGVSMKHTVRMQIETLWMYGVRWRDWEVWDWMWLGMVVGCKPVHQHVLIPQKPNLGLPTQIKPVDHAACSPPITDAGPRVAGAKKCSVEYWLEEVPVYLYRMWKELPRRSGWLAVIGCDRAQDVWLSSDLH
jgi:hypothetical protein